MVGHLFGPSSQKVRPARFPWLRVPTKAETCSLPCFRKGPFLLVGSWIFKPEPTGKPQKQSLLVFFEFKTNPRGNKHF